MVRRVPAALPADANWAHRVVCAAYFLPDKYQAEPGANSTNPLVGRCSLPGWLAVPAALCFAALACCSAGKRRRISASSTPPSPPLAAPGRPPPSAARAQVPRAHLPCTSL